MRCPQCGATNPDAAKWCGQCLARFEEARPSDAVPQAPAPAPAQPGAVAQTPSPAAADAAAPSPSGNFRRRGDEIEWACPSCGEFNSIDLQNCSVCGTGFVEQFRADEVQPDHNWSQALLMSAVAPGAGHMAIGRYGSGVARLVLFLTWAGGAIALAGGGGRALVAVAPLALGVVVVWAASLVDLYRLQQGDEELLVGRRLLWLVVGVLILLGIGLFASLATAGT